MTLATFFSWADRFESYLVENPMTSLFSLDETHFWLPPRKYWLITQEAVAPSRHDWKIVDWDVKPHHKQIISDSYMASTWV